MAEWLSGEQLSPEASEFLLWGTFLYLLKGACNNAFLQTVAGALR